MELNNYDFIRLFCACDGYEIGWDIFADNRRPILYYVMRFVQ